MVSRCSLSLARSTGSCPRMDLLAQLQVDRRSRLVRGIASRGSVVMAVGSAFGHVLANGSTASTARAACALGVVTGAADDDPPFSESTRGFSAKGSVYGAVHDDFHSPTPAGISSPSTETWQPVSRPGLGMVLRPVARQWDGTTGGPSFEPHWV